MDHLPYLPFPPTWPIFTPKDKLADFFDAYARLLELNVWTSATVVSASWDAARKQWTVNVVRQVQTPGQETQTQRRTLHPRHIIQATGHSGKKNMPNFTGMNTFKGDLICHSSEFPGAKPNVRGKGKKAIVVGSCNSGHDIAQDYYENGYEVTMVQRSSTYVVTSNTIRNGLKPLFSEEAPPLDDADLTLWSLPSEVFKSQQIMGTKAQAEADAPLLQGLERAGFRVDLGPSGAGLLLKYLQRGGGYYIDVGASSLIADGKIAVKHGQEIAEILPHGIRFADGSTLEADEIVFATGYQARLIFGDAVADRIGDIWGFDQEGEVRTIWRRNPGLPGFWFMGGNLMLARYFSRMLALQIKAIEVGIA